MTSQHSELRQAKPSTGISGIQLRRLFGKEMPSSVTLFSDNAACSSWAGNSTTQWSEAPCVWVNGGCRGSRWSSWSSAWWHNPRRHKCSSLRSSIQADDHATSHRLKTRCPRRSPRRWNQPLRRLPPRRKSASHPLESSYGNSNSKAKRSWPRKNCKLWRHHIRIAKSRPRIWRAYGPPSRCSTFSEAT